MNCKSGFPKVKENFDNLNNDCKNQPKKYFSEYTDVSCDNQPAIGWFAPFTNQRSEAAANRQANCRLDCDRKFPSITVFEHCNFSGRSLNCGEGITSFEQLQRQGFNNIIRSVRITPGTKATFYQTGFLTIRSWELYVDHDCLVNIGLFNFLDPISSIKVERI
jgi:hypothetical protein